MCQFGVIRLTPAGNYHSLMAFVSLISITLFETSTFASTSAYLSRLFHIITTNAAKTLPLTCSNSCEVCNEFGEWLYRYTLATNEYARCLISSIATFLQAKTFAEVNFLNLLILKYFLRSSLGNNLATTHNKRVTNHP